MLKQNIKNKKYKITLANKYYYDEIAQNYLINEYYAYTENITNDVKRLVKLAIKNTSEKNSFLDIACGSGFISKIVHKTKIFKKGIGVDISKKQIELYNNAFKGSNFIGKVCDANNLSFIKDNSIDLICGYSVLHHFFDYYSVLNECQRILKPGGVLYFDFEPNHEFKKKFKYLINFKRAFFDRSPSKKRGLEQLAEYHNNFRDGINFNDIRKFLDKMNVIMFDYRFPGNKSGVFLKKLKFIGNFMCPLFYFIMKKNKK